MSELDPQFIEEVEVTISAANEMIEQLDCIERLYKNKDFQKIILEEFFNGVPSKLANFKAQPSFASPERQAQILVGIDAVGYLREFFRVIEQQGAMAREAKAEGEQVLLDGAV